MSSQDDIAKLLLRLALGILVLLHGIVRMNHGLGDIISAMQAHGWPTFIAYFVYIGEVIAPILLLIGVLSRFGAFLIVINMIFTIFLLNRSQLFMLNNQGGWQLELPAIYLFCALAIALLGAGRFSMGGTGSRWN